jgi:hypothetical protein
VGRQQPDRLAGSYPAALFERLLGEGVVATARGILCQDFRYVL